MVPKWLPLTSHALSYSQMFTKASVRGHDWSSKRLFVWRRRRLLNFMNWLYWCHLPVVSVVEAQSSHESFVWNVQASVKHVVSFRVVRAGDYRAPLTHQGHPASTALTKHPVHSTSPSLVFMKSTNQFAFLLWYAVSVRRWCLLTWEDRASSSRQQPESCFRSTGSRSPSFRRPSRPTGRPCCAWRSGVWKSSPSFW